LNFRYEYDLGNFEIDETVETRTSLNQAAVIDNPNFDDKEKEDLEQIPFQIRFSSKNPAASVRGRHLIAHN